MNVFESSKGDYAGCQISKTEFIEKMFASHQRLFEYRESLCRTIIKDILISSDRVVFGFKDPEIKMICPPGDQRIVPIEAFNFGSYESEEIQIVKMIVGELGGSSVRFLDIGANGGFYSIALAHYFPGIRGLAFEPIPTTFSMLEENLVLNQVSGVRALNIGLSNQSGEIRFYTYPSQSGSSSMTKNIGDAEAVEVRCPVMRMDECAAVQEMEKIDFIKCDVEGAEFLVFQGGMDLLTNHKPAIFTEMLRKWSAQYNYHPNEIIELFSRMNYQCFTIVADGLNKFDSMDENTLETNFVFLHRESHSGVIGALSNAS